MSKVVQGIGDAIGDVVKGVVNVVKGVADGVGDLVRGIADSPIGKAILIAGAVYFGGAALAGGFGEVMGGGNFLAGMGAGVESAATGLSSAWSSTLAGNFGEAASTIGNTYGTAYGAGESAGMLSSNLAAGIDSSSLISQGGYNPGLVNPVPTYTGSEIAGLGPGADQVAAANLSGAGGEVLANPNLYAQGAAPTLNGLTGAAPVPGTSPFSLTAAGTGTPGLSAPLPAWGAAAPPAAAPAGWWSGLDPMVKYGAVMAGTQVAGGLIAGAGQAKAAQEQRDYEAQAKTDALARYNANNGAMLDFSPFARPAAPQPQPRYYPQSQPQYYPQSQPQYYPQTQTAMQQPPGIVSRYMYPTRA